MEKRARWDEVFGPVALLFKTTRAWDPLDYASFGHYCEEGSEMSERAVAQRVALERSRRRMQFLRQALREGRISYEKARLIARHATGRTRNVDELATADEDESGAERFRRPGTYGVSNATVHKIATRP